MAFEKFHYDFDGVEIVIPRFKNIPVGIIRRVRNQSEVEQIFTVLEEVTDETTLAVIDGMDTEQLQAFIAAWQGDSKVALGESSASAD